MIKVNQKMAQILCDLHTGREHQLSPPLRELLDAGLIEENGCSFLTKCRCDPKYTLAEFPDRTGLEYFVNHVHVEDYVEEGNPVVLQEQGPLYAKALQRILEPHGSFYIIVSMSDTDFDDKPNFLTCTVSFHKVRVGEFLLDEDLETYHHDAMLVLVTASGTPEST
jgi:hypothetical protein